MAAKFGVFVPQGWRLDLVHIVDPIEQYETMTRFGLEAEKLGYDSIWLYDHFHTVPTQELETTFECWTSTAALARDTSHVRIGQMCTCNHYRDPSLMAKMASTVDVMSGGRLDFGIGAGWYEEEFRAYGYPFPEGPVRLRMLDEALQIIRGMWTEPHATFEGEHYRIQGAINEPKGVQKPYPRLWVAGGGEQVTLKLVAKYADACNVVGSSPEAIKHKFDVLREHCDKLGRDHNSILKTVHSFLVILDPGEDLDEATSNRGNVPLEVVRNNNHVGTAEEIVEQMGRLADVGVEYFIVYFRGKPERKFEYLHAFAEKIMPAFR